MKKTDRFADGDFALFWKQKEKKRKRNGGESICPREGANGR